MSGTNAGVRVLGINQQRLQLGKMKTVQGARGTLQSTQVDDTYH